MPIRNEHPNLASILYVRMELAKKAKNFWIEELRKIARRDGNFQTELDLKENEAAMLREAGLTVTPKTAFPKDIDGAVICTVSWDMTWCKRVPGTLRFELEQISGQTNAYTGWICLLKAAAEEGKNYCDLNISPTLAKRYETEGGLTVTKLNQGNSVPWNTYRISWE